MKLFVSQSSGFSLAAEAPLSSQSATLTVDRPISTTPLRAMVSLSLAPEAPALTWIRLTLSGLGVEVPDGIQGPPLTGPSLSVRDGEIPSTPVVELGSRFIKSKGLLAARWESRVPRSVIEEYRVGVGISSDPSVYEGSDAFAALAFRGDGYGVSSRGTHVGHGRRITSSSRPERGGKWSAVGVSQSLVADAFKPELPSQKPQARNGDRQVLLSWPPAQSGPSGIAWYEVERRKGSAPKWELIGIQVAASQAVVLPERSREDGGLAPALAFQSGFPSVARPLVLGKGGRIETALAFSSPKPAW